MNNNKKEAAAVTELNLPERKWRREKEGGGGKGKGQLVASLCNRADLKKKKNERERERAYTYTRTSRGITRKCDLSRSTSGGFTHTARLVSLVLRHTPKQQPIKLPCLHSPLGKGVITHFRKFEFRKKKK